MSKRFALIPLVACTLGLAVGACPVMQADRDVIPVPSGEVVTMAIKLTADPYKLPSRSVPIDFIMQSVDDKTLQTIEDAKFLGPFRQ